VDALTLRHEYQLTRRETWNVLYRAQLARLDAQERAEFGALFGEDLSILSFE
jgi:hypothetical protein